MPPPPLTTRASSEDTDAMSTRIICMLLEDLHEALATGLDAIVEQHGIAGPKAALSPEALEAWAAFPDSSAAYTHQVARLGSVAASVHCEEALIELAKQWLPIQLAGGAGSAFMSSRFSYDKFRARLRCQSFTGAAYSTDKKEMASRHAEEAKASEAVRIARANMSEQVALGEMALSEWDAAVTGAEADVSSVKVRRAV